MQIENIQIILGFIFALVISIFSRIAKFLSFSGAIAIFILADLIFSLGGWQWTLPILTFFVLSSLLSKFRASRNSGVELFFEKSGVRDWMQVFANGGIGGIIIVFYFFFPAEQLYVLYVSSISAVCADTWATEIGTMFNSKTVNIVSFKPVEQGISGGISFPGFIGGILGSLIMALSSLYWINYTYLFYISIIVSAGLFGSIIDSILGSLFQIQFKCIKCGSITERSSHCGFSTIKISGIKWMNNDAVNLLASVAGGIFALIFLEFYKV